MADHKVAFLGDINLRDFSDMEAPFQHVREALLRTDIVLGNLECCLYPPENRHAYDGCFLDPRIGVSALRTIGAAALGLANNVVFGEPAILSTLSTLREAGIPQTEAACG